MYLIVSSQKIISTTANSWCVVQCILSYPNLVYPNPRLSQVFQLVTAHAQLINFKDGAHNICWCVHNAVVWLIHCGAKEKEHCIIG